MDLGQICCYLKGFHLPCVECPFVICITISVAIKSFTKYT